MACSFSIFSPCGRWKPAEVSAIIISSVVPPLESTLRQVCERYFNLKPMFVEPGIKTGMPILVDNPTEVGADRLVNSVAAFARYGGPCIVVDFGTATTFDVISAKGEYMGGAIAPGLAISAEALFARAARLSRVDVKKPAKVVGTNTVAARPERAVLRLHRPGGWHPGAHSERDAGPGLGRLRRSLPPAAWPTSSSMIQGLSKPSTTCSRSMGCA